MDREKARQVMTTPMTSDSEGKATCRTCGCEFTKQDAIDAEKWWGGKDYPVAFMKFCKEKPSSQPLRKDVL